MSNDIRASTAAPGPAPVAAPSRPRERRLRSGHLALAVALIVVGALGTVALVTAASATGEYLALTREVEFGAELTTADLTVVRIGNAPELDPVPASERGRVIGLFARMPLAKGSLLTAAQLTSQPVPGPGQHVLGITLREDRLPATRPRPGDPIMLVATAPPGSQTAGELATDPRTWPATVVAVAAADSGGFLGSGGSAPVTLDVAVATTDGPTVATLAAGNRLVVLLTEG